MPVMTPNELSNLVKYKYNGGDTSYVYKYVLSPLAEFCVQNFVPRSMAPNLITLSGLFFTLCSFFCTIVYNPTLSSDAPRWVALITAINLFVYQTLDNMDGKQARRTGTSSPLGMLFDHGIDAINCGLMMLPTCSALGTGRCMNIFLLFTMGFVPFYTQTWEEYYREEMVLPVVNGPTEGLLLIMAMCVYSFFYGSEHLHQATNKTPASLLQLGPMVPENYSPFDAITVAFSIAVSITIVSNVYTACKHAAAMPNKSFFSPLLTLSPFAVFFVSSFCYCFLSKIAVQEHSILVTILMSSVFVEITTHVMLMHICHSNIRPGERYTVWLPMLLAANLAFSPTDATGLVDELPMLISFSAASFLYSLHRVLSIWNESASALDVYLLVQGRPSEQEEKDI